MILAGGRLVEDQRARLEGQARWRARAASAGRTRASAAAARGCPPRRRGPAQRVGDSASRVAGSAAQVARAEEPAPRGPSGRRASGSGSGTRSRRSRQLGDGRPRVVRAVDEDRAAHRRQEPSWPLKSVVLPEPFGPSTATDLGAAEVALDAVQDLALAEPRATSRYSSRGGRAGRRVRGRGGRRRASPRRRHARAARNRARMTSNGSLTAPGRRSRGTRRPGRGSARPPPGTARGRGGARAPPRRGARR